MKRILLFLLLTACMPNKREADNFTLSGVLEGQDYSGFVYLNYDKFRDSLKVENNRFEFEGSVEKPIEGFIHLESISNFAPLYIENSNLKINFKYELSQLADGQPMNSLTIDSIHGSHSAKLQNHYNEVYHKNKAKDNFDEILYSELTDFFRKNPKHPISGKILADLTTLNSVLAFEQLEHLYQILDTTFLHENDLRNIKVGLNNLMNHNIGDPFPELILPNPDYVKIRSADYQGKILLIDFWASWCGPCRIKHPKLIDLYEKYHYRDFDLLSVSIDNDREKWINAIEEDHLTWNNAWDADKQIHDKLGIRAIPFNYLIDQEGIIIGINLTIEQIEKILTEKNSG